jgi:arginase family enzyme
MLSKSIRILNFDDSVIKQQNLVSRYHTEIVDLKDLGPRARIWLDKKTEKEIEKRIRGSAKNSVTFLGSGDFHQVSHILINQFDEPICVILFDFHPDWDILPPRLGCGSWVTESLRNKNILRFILIGTSSKDLSSPWIQTGNINSLQGNRVEIYPYSHRPSFTFFKRMPENLSIKIKKSLFVNKIHWNELKGKDLIKLFLSILKRLPTPKVYLSIDKDCLRNEYSLTNWEEGMLSLEELLWMLKLIMDHVDIIGMDIVGDYSEISVNGKLRKLISYLDHPGELKAKYLSEAFVNEINERTNLSFLELLNVTPLASPL